MVKLFICRQKGFRRYLLEIIDRVLEFEGNRIFFICAGGQHRSVFIADIFENLFPNSVVEHLSLKEPEQYLSIHSKDLFK